MDFDFDFLYVFNSPTRSGDLPEKYLARRILDICESS